MIRARPRQDRRATGTACAAQISNEFVHAMTKGHALEPAMFCLGCRYPLDSLSSTRCPECGRGFDPNNAYTFARSGSRLPCQIAGAVTLFGGIFFFLLQFAIAPFTGRLIVDIVPLIIAGLGTRVRRGVERAAKWAVGLSLLEAFCSFFGAVLFCDSTPGASAGVHRTRLLVIVAVATGIWSVANIFLLFRFLKQSGQTAQRRSRVAMIIAITGGCLALVLVLLLTKTIITNIQYSRAPLCTVVIQTIDARTGQQLQTSIGGPSYGWVDPWSLSYTSISQNQMELTWKAFKPLPISVSATGYQKQQVTLDEHSPATMNIQLEKSNDR